MLWPGTRCGQEPLMPSRLMRRQKMTPMRTSLPLAKRMLFRGWRISTM